MYQTIGISRETLRVKEPTQCGCLPVVSEQGIGSMSLMPCPHGKITKKNEKTKSVYPVAHYNAFAYTSQGELLRRGEIYREGLPRVVSGDDIGSCAVLNVSLYVSFCVSSGDDIGSCAVFCYVCVHVHNMLMCTLCVRVCVCIIGVHTRNT